MNEMVQAVVIVIKQNGESDGCPAENNNKALMLLAEYRHNKTIQCYSVNKKICSPPFTFITVPCFWTTPYKAAFIMYTASGDGVGRNFIPGICGSL